MSSEKITWKTCKKCNFLQHLDHNRCLNCNHNEFEEVQGKGSLKLVTYTILTAPPKEYMDQRPYALGIAKFENGIKILGQLTTTENLQIGMALTPVRAMLCSDLDGKEINGFKMTPI